ncbi:MAG: ATP-dependent RecD-like DNA helicase [Verrucomicrobiota bacterium]
MPTPAPSNAAPEETITGIIDHIVYRSEESGYTVCVLKTTGHKEGIVVVGTCAAIWAGENLQAEGRWIRHKTHGLQFNAHKMVCVEPQSAAGIEKYLASGLIQGIGPVLAGRLVRKFGENTLRIIERESARLEAVEGIGRKRREQIKASWNEQKTVRDIMIFLHGHNVRASQAMRIYRAYGDDAIALVRANPYRLAADIWGIGFKSADKIAMDIGIPPQSVVRAQAGIIYTLQTLMNEGHCYCPRAELLATAEQLLAIPPAILEEALALELGKHTLIEEDTAIYIAALFHAETGIATQITRLLKTPPRWIPKDTAKAIHWAAGRMRITFAPCQVQALRLALMEKVSIITGGPGVGKTTIIRALVDMFSAKRQSVCLAAPTGRAAKRMEEATRHPAMTLHRLLKFMPTTGRFAHNQSSPLAGDVFVLDEVSMIDVSLMLNFLLALPPASRLVIVGDADQLPSVGPGNVLRDMIASGALPAVKLDVIFRQSARSWIVHNAHQVNTGQFFDAPPADENSDFYFVDENDPDKVIRAAIELITKRIPQRFGLNPRTDIQLLTPMRRFQLGAENMNAILQDVLNPRGESVTRYGRIYRAGDRVMQMRNNYDKDVYNGDIGQIRAISDEDQEVEVDFDGRRVIYQLYELDELSIAYASSIHKAQGSEHPAVVILMTTQHYKLLQRNLLYTALTRGRKLVCLIGSKKAVSIAIRNNCTIERRTRLRERLAAIRKNGEWNG